MIRKIGKRGVEHHIEIILSFVIFVGFIIFLFTFLKPVRNKDISQTVLDAAQRGIENNVSVNYNYVSIKTNNSISGCFCASLDIKSMNIVVRDEVGIVVDSELRGEYVCIQGNGYKFYTIYYSSIFESGSNLEDCEDLPEGNYSFGLLRENKVLGYPNLLSLNQSYNENYDSIKDDLNVPSSNDFGFLVRESTGVEIIKVMKKQPSKISIIARDIPSRLLNESGDVRYVILNVQAW